MLNLKNFKGFAIANGDTSIESKRLHFYAITHDLPIMRVNHTDPCPPDYIPCGSVEWCLVSLEQSITPDYYPEWATAYLHRKVWRNDKWILGQRLFVKPADRYKRFTGFVTTGTYRKKKRGKLIWSEVVSFTNEWRYYISGGKVLAAHWYSGEEEKMPPAPKLELTIPSDYFGALDMGTLRDGTLCLVESQHPFACGWYGGQEEDEIYFQWLIDGWEYMLGDKKF